MGLFDHLFGHDKKNPPSPEPATSTQEPRPLSVRRRVNCDVCNLTREATVDKNEAFTGGMYLMTFKLEEFLEVIPFVASCETCDIDVCNYCVRWSVVPHPDPEVAKNLHADAKCFKSLCPTCGGDLGGKSKADARRLVHGMRELRRQDIVRKLSELVNKPENEQKKAKRIHLSRKLTRIFTEEYPYLNRLLDQQALEELKQDLVTFGKENERV